jgi:hypothetical protein
MIFLHELNEMTVEWRGCVPFCHVPHAENYTVNELPRWPWGSFVADVNHINVHDIFIIIIIIIMFQGLGLLACSSSEFIFWNLWIYWTVGRTPGTGDRPDARPLPTHRTAQHIKTRTHIHASSGIQTHDPSGQAAHWDRPLRFQWLLNYQNGLLCI